MQDLTTFSYNGAAVRTQLSAEGEPLFCLADVCKVLELANPTHTANALKEEFGCPTLNVGHLVDSLGRDQEATFITEPQLYFVMMRSRSDKAKPFRQWVVNEVLPTIRKTGRYEAPNYALADRMAAGRIVLEAAGITGNQLALALDKAYRAETGTSMLGISNTQLIAPQQAPLLTPSEIGAPLGLSAIAVNKRLAALGYQSKGEAGWELSAAGAAAGGTYLDVGKRRSNGTPIRQLKWPAGILG